MKKYFLAITSTLLLASSASAYEGIVIVLEAPLLRAPQMDAKVLQILRKGQRVYIPNEIGNHKPTPNFIATFDRAGNRAFIPSKYVKMITGTLAEYEQPIALEGHDPTDYRIEEPITASYPFEDRTFARASVALMAGNNASTPYAYNSTFNKQSYGAELGLRIGLSKKIAYDKYDRFYFGFVGFITTTTNTTNFKNANVADENRTAVRVGPWITYDAYKDDKYRLNLGTGFTFNYHHSILRMSNELEEESKTFTGISISPMVGSTFQVSDIIPNTDFITGVDLSLYLPYGLTSSQESEHPELWGETNQIKSTLKAQASLYLGVQVKY